MKTSDQVRNRKDVLYVYNDQLAYTMPANLERIHNISEHKALLSYTAKSKPLI